MRFSANAMRTSKILVEKILPNLLPTHLKFSLNDDQIPVSRTVYAGAKQERSVVFRDTNRRITARTKTSRNRYRKFPIVASRMRR